MSFLGPAILLLCFGAIALSRRSPSLWLAGVLGRTALVALMALAAWFGSLMTGVIGSTGWSLAGHSKLEPPRDKIAFRPALVVGAAYSFMR
jgi:hypothetical protein